jgi:hypothetical protein
VHDDRPPYRLSWAAGISRIITHRQGLEAVKASAIKNLFQTVDIGSVSSIQGILIEDIQQIQR